MFSLINRQVDDLRPGSTVGEKKQKKNKKKTASIGSHCKQKENSNKQTNKQTGWESDESS